jgi:hypothetical protein
MTVVGQGCWGCAPSAITLSRFVPSRVLCHTRSWPASQHRSSIIAPGPTSKPPRSDDPSFVSVPTFQDSDLTFWTPHLSFRSFQTIRFSADLLGRLLFPIIAQQVSIFWKQFRQVIHLERPARPQLRHSIHYYPHASSPNVTQSSSLSWDTHPDA